MIGVAHRRQYQLGKRLLAGTAKLPTGFRPKAKKTAAKVQAAKVVAKVQVKYKAEF